MTVNLCLLLLVSTACALHMPPIYHPCRADVSSQGLSNSCGLMVNYLYDLDQVVANNQRYLLEHHIAASDTVRQLL